MEEMMFRRAAIARLLLLVSLPGLTSCLVRRRVITRQGNAPVQTLLTADKQTLLQRISAAYSAIQNLNATVDMVPALGSADKGKITEYKDVRAYILFRKPEQIRLIGLYPVVRNTAFDMVSDGEQFRLYIPSRNRFITGKDEIIAPSKNRLENLRPHHFTDALLIPPPAAEQAALIENLTDEESANYILSTIRKTSAGELTVDRSIWFDRVTLNISRQIIFDPSGNILTDARYRDWQRFDGIPFPKQIEMNRPQDEYGVVMTIVKMEINKGLPDERFVLERPEGTTLQVLGPPQKPSGAADGRSSEAAPSAPAKPTPQPKDPRPR
jgi:outer membrane lipoprotein-sorting protein